MMVKLTFYKQVAVNRLDKEPQKISNHSYEYVQVNQQLYACKRENNDQKRS